MSSSENDRIHEQDARNMDRRRSYARSLFAFDWARFEAAMLMRAPAAVFYRKPDNRIGFKRIVP